MIDKKELPENWEVKKLGDVCFTTSGGTPSRKILNYYGGNIPWVKSGELDRGLILDTEEKITDDAIKNSSAKVFPKGTLLIALYGATIGKLAFLGIDAATNQAVCGIYQNEKVLSGFLSNFLYFKRPSLVKEGIGGAQPNISQGILKNLDLPLPPIEEQEQIVAKIEELVSELDAGVENLKKAQAQLITYRQAVLKSAFDGELTTEWRKTDNEGLSAFEWLRNVAAHRKKEFDLAKKRGVKHLDKTYDFEFAESDEIDGWATAKLDKLIYIAGRIGWRGLKKDEYTSDGPLFLSVHSLNYGKYVALDQAFHISLERYLESPEIILREDDILLCKDGAGIGKIGIVKKLAFEATVNSSLLVIRGLEIFVPEFLFYLFGGPKLQTIVQERITGSATPHLFQRDIRNFRLLIPSFEEQRRIVEEIENRLSVCDKLEETIAASLKQSEALRQGILKQAFEGKLVKPIKGKAKTRNIYLEQMQFLGDILWYSDQNGIKHTEMTAAKYAFLLDRLCDIPTTFEFERLHLGPYPKGFQKIINNRQYFQRIKGLIYVNDWEKLHKYNYPGKDLVEPAIKRIAGIFNKADHKKRNHKTELLATVCKVIEDIGLTDFEVVRKSMKDWPIDLKDSKVRNKAEKFDETETKKCIAYIIREGWDKKLIQTDG